MHWECDSGVVIEVRERSGRCDWLWRVASRDAKSCQVYKGSKTLSSCRDRLDAIGLITEMVATEVRVVPGWC